MQDTDLSPENMSPYMGSKYESPISSRTPSPGLVSEEKYISDDEISVGCPSPARESSPGLSEDYFKPLKKLKMVETEPTADDDKNEGVRSFSIVDILNHKPSKSQSKIVRPWDIDPDIEAQQRLETFHRHLKVQQLALLRPDFANFSATYASETGSDRSSSVASDCCSPDIVTTASQRHRQGKNVPGATPLDALFQMTSKTFDSSAGEGSAGKKKTFCHNKTRNALDL